MRLEEFEDFRAELKQLCATLGKAYTDALAQAYWRALKDASLTEIQANVERILLTQNKDAKFPKPFELRSTPTTRGQEGLPDHALKLNEEAWREKFSKNPEQAEREHRWCRLQRMLASEPENSVQYAEALKESLIIQQRYGNPRFW